MYAETGLLFPCFQNFSPESLHFDDFYIPQKLNSCLNNLVQSTTLEYDMTAESNLFKAPEPIIKDPIMDLDPATAAITMINSEENIIESLQSDPLLCEMFYELEKTALDITPYDYEVLDMKMIPMMMPINENESSPCDFFQKSVSSECLSSMKWDRENKLTPFVDFEGYGMRRSFSEGNIKNLGVMNSIQLQPSAGFSNCNAEERREKLSRYRNKKTRRNFGRKIKYACRKALADNQPRIRGRFTKTEEPDGPKKL